ncbi:sensor domain-containing phosphodiesterase [Trinickia caryophylli]|uniref:Diguanylate cyclase/phosphodiesterase with PAS/PAC sensor(S) n=1 Tax=Trinickia caryophylli TaxID=28094 RepID=A0A1X7DY63_TRICW|nr:sensor domain-containing phosphodiesterase [Trinickia caryophylli]PMS14179.1 sensor domain-containing phosphodiesterase [Trinickia caryophylli]TRX17877.1 sensor domain-containing phosphodiesterase [Trinickia caryophylli]WQE11353.1 sensor domain-containing phosphodiesterase [Trinickia caryophylli]SMF23514.1 diguanylate cyclase/phosphodiesterase with PAS/PAC sensor(s) [Trinickia caryophylli]GLU32510.1 GGDEF domain-containing protein [Trinickia caryophylli]
MEGNIISTPRRGAWRAAIDLLWRRGGSSARGSATCAGDALAAELERLVGAVDFLAHVDAQLRFLYVSEASLRFVGYRREYLQAVTLHELVAAGETAELDALVAKAAASGRVERATLHLMKSLTYPIPVELRVVPSMHDGIPGFAVSAFDVANWRAAEERLTYELHNDRMTGLANGTALASALKRAQEYADAEGTGAALLLIDLDDYQRVNRALGYDAGDALLRDTAQRLSGLVSSDEMLARVTSDEFAILVRCGTRDHAAAAAEALARRLMTAIQQPYSFNGQPVHLSTSVGIALYPAPGEDGWPGHHEQFMRRADHALAQAKASGSNAIAFHTPDADPADAERLKLEADLYDGVRNGEFALHFQPITSSHTGGVVGVEALIRWHHPVHGLVPPSTFIPLAESIGLINYLGNWVLKVACMQLVQWDAQDIALQYVAVNVSPQQFRDPRFTQNVREALDLTGVNPRRLVLEITESLLMQDPAHAKTLLEELTAAGIRFAVDDFGTGYSSLAYLQRFPLAKLKIDRSFVENLITSRNDQAIVSAVVGLARTLDLELVAEGVETEAQRQLLTQMGCGHIQGWLVCKALPSEELAQRFASRALRLHEVEAAA